MPSHTVSFSICVDLELFYEQTAPDVLVPDRVQIDVIDNEGRAAPKWLLRAIGTELYRQHDRIMEYMAYDAKECARG